MASLQPRHRWMTSCIATTFGPDVTETNAEDFFRESDTRAKIDEFLSGKTESRHIFIFYQGQKVEVPFGSRALCNPVANTDVQADDAHSKLFMTDGKNEAIKGKCCYFIRNINDGEQVDVSKVRIPPGDASSLLHASISSDQFHIARCRQATAKSSLGSCPLSLSNPSRPPCRTCSNLCSKTESPGGWQTN